MEKAKALDDEIVVAYAEGDHKRKTAAIELSRKYTRKIKAQSTIYDDIQEPKSSMTNKCK